MELSVIIAVNDNVSAPMFPPVKNIILAKSSHGIGVTMAASNELHVCERVRNLLAWQIAPCPERNKKRTDAIIFPYA